MAETTPPTTGALASVSGFFSDLMKSVTPVAQTYLTYKAADKAADAPKQPAPVTQPTDWRSTVAQPTGAAAITSAPWFPFAVGGLILAVLGGLFLVLRRK